MDLRLRPYLMRECYSAQIEAVALINVRFRYTCLGIAYPRSWQQLRSAAWGWREWFPRLSLAFGAYSSNDIWDRVRIDINWLRLVWSVAGESHRPRKHPDAGLHLWWKGWLVWSTAKE